MVQFEVVVWELTVVVKVGLIEDDFSLVGRDIISQI
jgi:hypothetical protein